MSGPRERVLAAVGQALASVGHELNNVASVLHSYASFIQEGSTEPAIVADAQVIRTTTDRAALLARQLLAFGHPREREPEALELGAFVTDAHGLLERVLGGSTLAVEASGSPVFVHVRRAELGRVLLELVLLLEPRLAPGSTLTLGAQLSGRDASSPKIGEIWLRERIASDAPRAERVGPVLDLESVRAWAQEQSGALDVVLDSASGVSLSLGFPALDGVAPAAEPATLGAPIESRGAETVLLVEADGELRLAVCRMLEAAGYRAVEAEDAEVARSLGLDGDMPIDLLLTCGSAFDAASEQLAEQLRHQHPRLQSLRHMKPFTSAELQSAVRLALDERTRLSHTAPASADRVLSLVVDDDQHVRLALSRILADVGADVVTAPSGLHALQKLESLPIDLVIADQAMPGMDGMRLLESVYRTWPRVVRVVYTGYLSSGLLVDAVNRANVHKVLAKDMTPEALRDELGEVVREIRAGRSA